MIMTRSTSKTRRVLQIGSLPVLLGAVLTIPTPAHAGYDEATGMATNSYSRNTASRNTTMSRRTMSNTMVYGTYITTSTMGNITLVGTLTGDADDKNFTLRDSWGRTYNVETSRFVQAEAANKLQKGDMVRVYGEWSDNMLRAANIRTISSNAVALGTRVRYGSRYYTMGRMNTLTGTLITDADDDEFEIRAANGVVYMIRTPAIPDSAGANKLQKGQRVRVYGYWIGEAGGGEPQLEALSYRVL